MKKIDLSGAWEWRGADGAWMGGFMLPGSACENKVGKKREYREFSKAAVRAPRERYEYIGELYVRRNIEIPQDWAGKTVRLFLERVNIATEIWLDGERIGRKNIGLSTPHIYDISHAAAGTHSLVICIDNRNLVNMDIMASGYSIDTQGYWNGIIGRIELQCEEKSHIDSVQVYTDEKGIKVRVVEVSENYSPMEQTDCAVSLSVTDPKGNQLGTKRFERKLWVSKQPDYYRYDIDAPEFWSEFNPALYTLTVRYECGGVCDTKTVRFGMRTIKSENKKLMLNGRQISLRGTIDCAQFPISAYPAMDKPYWERIFRIIKEYGLNHMRFHAWCPPEAAFDAADEAGIYVSVEMPLWLNKDVCALELGDDPIHYDYYPREAVRISDTYGNHPSFVMFSCGNETMGDFALLERIIIQTKAYDPRRIYTITTNFDHEILPCEDYFCAYDANLKHIRIQNLHDEVAKDTCLDYSASVEEMPVPLVSFEVGQYCTYPNVDICEEYTGNVLPVNFEAIRRHMKSCGVYDRLDDYIKASGDLQIKLYKEDFEAALRTKDFGGIEILSLIDYTGQSTATVGALDVFYNSKGIVTAEQWREFCGETVPLFKSKRIFKNTDILEAELDLYDFSEHPIPPGKAEYRLRICRDGKELFSRNTTNGSISLPLSDVKESAILNVELSVGEYKNSWRIFVFNDSEPEHEPRIIRTESELKEIIENGGRAIVGRELFKDAKEGSFIPVFWSPVHFPTPKPLGAIIDTEHPIMKEFPTEKYLDYQWKTLMDNSLIMQLPEGAKPIVEIVPNFVDNTAASPLFELTIGKAKLLYCGFDPDIDDITVRAMKCAVYGYMNI